MRRGGTFYFCTCCGYRGRITKGLGSFTRKLWRAHQRGIEAANG